MGEVLLEKVWHSRPRQEAPKTKGEEVMNNSRMTPEQRARELTVFDGAAGFCESDVEVVAAAIRAAEIEALEWVLQRLDSEYGNDENRTVLRATVEIINDELVRRKGS